MFFYPTIREQLEAEVSAYIKDTHHLTLISTSNAQFQKRWNNIYRAVNQNNLRDRAIRLAWMGPLQMPIHNHILRSIFDLSKIGHLIHEQMLVEGTIRE